MDIKRQRVRVGLAVVGVMALFPSGGCGPKGTRGGPAPPGVEATSGQSTCRPAKDPLHPLIVEWPATSKTELEAALGRGPVVVSYVGCVLKVMTGCQASGGSGYETVTTTPSQQLVTMTNEQELYANLPLGVAKLSGQLTSGQMLRLEYVSVGEKSMKQPPTVVSGQCEGATHYVSSAVLGAFSLTSEARDSAGGEVGVGSVGVGAKGSAKNTLGGSSGDTELCRSKGMTGGASCGGLLQLGLSPLEVAGNGKVSAAGFGGGLGAMAVIPTLGNMQALGTASSLADVDTGLLDALQAAKRSEKAGSTQTSAQKADAWDALAQYKGTKGNAFASIAGQRRDDWKRVSEAEAKRLVQVQNACRQYTADSAKLQKLLGYDDEVISKEQKAAYKKELEKVYAPWQQDLTKCEDVVPELAEAKRAARRAEEQERLRKREALVGRMVTIAAGRYFMGSNNGEANERPAHEVMVPRFEMDVTEVTVAAYRLCVGDRKCSAPDTTEFCNWGQTGKENHPVNCVDWNQSEAFCAWAGKRLPTEEEWEYAARGLDNREFPWGNDTPAGRACWNRANSQQGTCEVGTFSSAASSFGLQDMAGNVWEWTSSAYSESYSNNRTSSARVIRGGSWGNDTPSSLRAARRGSNAPTDRGGSVGLRCARSLP